MSKFDLNDPAIKEFLSDPRIVELNTQLNEAIKAEYAKFDAIDFIGEAGAGLVKAYYSFGKKGFYKIEIADSTYADKAFVCDLIPAACNDAIIKYNVMSKEVEGKVIALQKEAYIKLANIALERYNNSVAVQATSNKKTYLN